MVVRMVGGEARVQIFGQRTLRVQHLGAVPAVAAAVVVAVGGRYVAMVTVRVGGAGIVVPDRHRNDALVAGTFVVHHLGGRFAGFVLLFVAQDVADVEARAGVVVVVVGGGTLRVW